MLTDTKPYYGLNRWFFIIVHWRKEALSIGELEKSESATLILKKEEEESIEFQQRRDRHDIIAEILKIAKLGEKKTSIMYKAKLSHAQLKIYLEFLNQSGMIVNKNGVYKTTLKGLTFVREFESINFLFRQ